MWVEPLVGEWISTSSPLFATEWPGFHKFSRGPFLKTFSLVPPTAVGLEIFVSDSEYIILTVIK